MSEKEAKKKRGKGEGDGEVAVPLPLAVSRMVGLHLGAFALVLTYLVAALNGVSAPTALLRAVIVFFVFLVIGRVIGLFIGRAMTEQLDPELQPREAEAAS